MEDRHSSQVIQVETKNGKETLGLFAVYDGHGGDFAADYCAKHFTETLLQHPLFPNDIPTALKETCENFDARLLEESSKVKTYSGCTLNYLLVGSQCLYCCNVGDSRAVLSRNGVAIALSKDHNISNAAEVSRVKQAGGFITHRGINDYMSVTRALGDLDLKGHKQKVFPCLDLKADLVIATPDIAMIDLQPDDEFLIIASDGLWCRLNDTEAVKLTLKTLRQYASPKIAAKTLIKTALSMGSVDNITAIVVVLHRQELMKDVTVHGGNIFGSFQRSRKMMEYDSSDDSGHGRRLFLNEFQNGKGKEISLLGKNPSSHNDDSRTSNKDTCKTSSEASNHKKEPNAWSRFVETYKNKLSKRKE
ncbi:Probable protein phosphatase 2C 10 [Galdieria sulphuraria]|nr:Probable protein phosphatase 2C 10 [Galdieria sulphuraria]